MPGTPHEHFDESAERAMSYMDMGKPSMAVKSLIIDLKLHPGTESIATSSELLILSLGTMSDPEKFREALNSLRAKML